MTCLEGAAPPSQKEFAFFSSNDTETGLSTSNILSVGRTDAIQIGANHTARMFWMSVEFFR